MFSVGKKQALWCFEMRDAWQPTTRLCQDIQLNLVELRKADRLGLASAALKAWVTFFEHWSEEEKMATIQHEPVHKALESLKHLSADAETRRLAFVRERALRDEATLRKMDREEGREEGIRAGPETVDGTWPERNRSTPVTRSGRSGNPLMGYSDKPARHPSLNRGDGGVQIFVPAIEERP